MPSTALKLFLYIWFYKNLVKSIMKKIFISLMLATCSMVVYAQSGSLDNTFNGNGIVTGNYTSGNNSADAMVIQPDGKIIVAGGTGTATNIKVGVSRHNADGTLDTTFATGGKMDFSSGWVKSFILDIKLQQDGKIVMGGYRWNNSTGDFIMVRLNPNGSFDTTFGTNGIAIIDGGQTEVAESFDIDSNGDYIISGYVEDDFAMAKVKSNGTIDTNFGNSGWVITPFSDFATYSFDTLISKIDGRIFLAGMLINGYENKYEYAIAAYRPNGTLDTSFGDEGKLNFHVGIDNDFGKQILQLDNGQILFAGHSWYATSPLRYEVAVVRLNANGSFDNTYGTNGIFKTRLVQNGTSYLTGIVLQKDEKLVLTASANEGNDYNFGLARVNPNGTLDTTFGQGGKVFTHIPTSTYGESYNVGLQPDGKIIVSGDTELPGSPIQYFIARFNDKVLAVQDTDNTLVQLYPNPATDHINLDFGKSGKEYEVEIYNMVGQKVMTATVANKSTLNVSSLVKGSYFVRLNGEGKTTTLQFIKK